MTWKTMPRKRWLTLQMVAWATYDLAVTIFSMIVITRFGGPWIIHEMGGSPWLFNLTYALSILAGGICQVLLSPISDELGRRRVFVIAFSLLCIGSTFLMGSAATLGRALFLFGLSNLGYQTSFVFYNAMLGDVSDDRHKSRVSGIGVGLGYVGSIIGLIVAIRYVDVQSHSYSRVFLPTAFMILAFALPQYFLVPDQPGLVHYNFSQSLRNSLGSFMTTLRRVVKHRELLFFFVGCLFALDAVHTVILNVSLYSEKVVGLDSTGHDYLLGMDEISFFLVTANVVAIFGAFAFGHIADKTRIYQTFLAVMVLWTAALILAMFSVQPELFWVTGPLFGLAFGGIWTVSRAYLQELSHPEERSQMFALFGFVNRGAAMIGPVVWGGTIYLTEDRLGEKMAYRLAIGMILLLMTLGTCFIWRGKPKDQFRPVHN